MSDKPISWKRSIWEAIEIVIYTFMVAIGIIIYFVAVGGN